MTATDKKKLQTADEKIEKYTQKLRVQLTPEEVADRADRAAQILADRDAKEEEQKAAAKHAKSVIESLDAQLREVSYEVRTRSTYQPVDCERKYLYGRGRLREIRLDTQEVLNDRKLTHDEMQRELFAAQQANGDGKEDDGGQDE